MIARRIGYFAVIGTLIRGGGLALIRPRRVSLDDTLTQMRSIGLGALPTACLITFTAGYVLALVLELQLSQLGRVELVPALLWIISTEQIVPLGVAFIFTGRSVSAVSAELGSMQVSEEIKALFTMGIDIVSYLLLPRYLAFQIMLPVVTIVGIYSALLGGWVLCGPVLQMSLSDYTFYVLDGSRLTSVITAIGKSALFGFIAATVAFYKGLNVRNGSQEISEATTQSVVLSVVLITVANAIVTTFQLAG